MYLCITRERTHFRSDLKLFFFLLSHLSCFSCFVLTISLVVYPICKFFGAVVKLAQWWLQVKIQIKCSVKVNRSHRSGFYFLRFWSLPWSFHMMTTEQVGCYSAFSVYMQSILWKNTERTSDGNGFSDWNCKTKTSLNCTTFLGTFHPLSNSGHVFSSSWNNTLFI